jgi:hypothetical protein
MTAPMPYALLARGQWVVQNSRAIPNAAHRTFGRFSAVGTEPFLDPGQFRWTPLLEQHYRPSGQKPNGCCRSGTRCPTSTTSPRAPVAAVGEASASSRARRRQDVGDRPTSRARQTSTTPGT